MKREFLPEHSPEGDKKKVAGWRLYPTLIAQVQAAAAAKNVTPEYFVDELLTKHFEKNKIKGDVVRVPMDAVVVRVKGSSPAEVEVS